MRNWPINNSLKAQDLLHIQVSAFLGQFRDLRPPTPTHDNIPTRTCPQQDCYENDCHVHITPTVSRIIVIIPVGAAVFNNIRNDKRKVSGRTYTIESQSSCMFEIKKKKELGELTKGSFDNAGAHLVRGGGAEDWVQDDTTGTKKHKSSHLQIVIRWSMDAIVPRLAQGPPSPEAHDARITL